MFTIEFTGGESFVLFVSTIGGGVAIFRWVRALCASPDAELRPATQSRKILAVGSAIAAAILAFILLKLTPREVRSSIQYVVLFAGVGVLTCAAVLGAASATGVSIARDALDNRNPAAALAVAGALVGTSLAYGGANVGQGATISTTLLPAALSVGTLIGAWTLLEHVACISDAIAIDRDSASAWRLAGFLIATGAISGRAVAGDYHSVWGTLVDFAVIAWPIAVLVVITAILQVRWRPTPHHPHPPVRRFGHIPAATLLIATALYILWTGAPR